MTSRSFSLIAVALILAPVTAALAPSELSVRTSGAVLPTPRSSAAAAYFEEIVYILGGTSFPSGEIYSEIVRFDPRDETVSIEPVQLPSARYGHATVPCAGVICVVGGWGWEGFHSDVLAFDPRSHSLTARVPLPVANAWFAAAAHGEEMFLFGGHTGSGYTDAIVRYNLSSGESAVMNARLPVPRAHATAVWLDGSYFIIGGSDRSDDAVTDEVLRYHPSEDRIEQLVAALPAGLQDARAIVTSERGFLVVGGSRGGIPDPGIVYYDVDNGTATILNASLPGGRTASMAVAPDDKGAWIFGGEDDWDASRSDIVLRVEFASLPTPAPPLPAELVEEIRASEGRLTRLLQSIGAAVTSVGERISATLDRLEAQIEGRFDRSESEHAAIEAELRAKSHVADIQLSRLPDPAGPIRYALLVTLDGEPTRAISSSPDGPRLRFTITVDGERVSAEPVEVGAGTFVLELPEPGPREGLRSHLLTATAAISVDGGTFATSRLSTYFR